MRKHKKTGEADCYKTTYDQKETTVMYIMLITLKFTMKENEKETS